MQTSKYWQYRAENVLKQCEKNSNKHLNFINRIYKETSESLAQSIRRILKGYNPEFNENEIRNWLNDSISVSEYNKLKDILITMPNGEYKQKLLKKINETPLKYRLKRKILIQDNILTYLGKSADIQLTTSTNAYKETINKSYTNTMFDIQKGINTGFSFTMVNEKAIDKLINSRVYGKSYSSRIWRNTTKTAEKAYEVLTKGMLQGDSIDTMARQLKEYTYDNSMFKATRLIRTEVNYYSNQGTAMAYKEAEIERYRYLATLDMRTSAVCGSLDGKVFELNNATVGVNYPPMHPFAVALLYR